MESDTQSDETMSNTQQVDDTVAEEEAEIGMIVGLGFSQAEARKALKAHGGNVDRAMDSLLLDSRAGSTQERPKSRAKMKESDDIENWNATPSLGVTVLADTNPRHQEEVRPGAVAVAGPDAEDGFSTVIPDSRLNSVNTSIPIAAELIDSHDDDYERIEDQLRKHDEQLQQVLADRANVPVAQVVDTSQKVKGNQRMKWKVAMAVLVLVIIGVVLGVVLSKKDEPTPPTSSTSAPTIPNASPSPPLTGTPPPTSLPAPTELIALLSSVSLDGGVALQTPSTPQYEALVWLADNLYLDEYSDDQKIQRYVLATLYYSTDGPNWKEQANWMRNEPECNWVTDAEGDFCSPDGEVMELDLWKNNLKGALPDEIALLSDSLCTYPLIALLCNLCHVSHLVLILQ